MKPDWKALQQLALENPLAEQDFAPARVALGNASVQISLNH